MPQKTHLIVARSAHFFFKSSLFLNRNAPIHAEPVQFVPVAVATVLLLGFGIYRYPYDTGVPGSNYDLLFGHFFFVGLAYAVIPGVAAVTAFLSALWYPRDNDIANNGA
jgi:hypothetical protein